MGLNLICPSCGAENFITRQPGETGDLRCSVCGEKIVIPAGGAARKSAFSRPADGGGGTENPSGVADRGATRSSGPGQAASGSLEPEPSYSQRAAGAYSGGVVRSGADASARKRRSIPVFGQVMIAVIVLTFIAAASMNRNEMNFNRAHFKKKSCVSNMKTIEGAMELYFMENRTDMFRNMQKFPMATLVGNGYLRGEIVCPDRGVYTITIFKRYESCTCDVKCDKHGALSEADKPGKGL